MPLTGLYRIVPALGNWSELVTQYNRLPPGSWIFRGQRDSTWHLQPSLERTIGRFGLGLAQGSRLEGGLLRRFQRHAQHYLPEVPDDRNFMEWLALMQHYGAPTRLLDWTHSFFVAAFFALD